MAILTCHSCPCQHLSLSLKTGVCFSALAWTVGKTLMSNSSFLSLWDEGLLTHLIGKGEVTHEVICEIPEAQWRVLGQLPFGSPHFHKIDFESMGWGASYSPGRQRWSDTWSHPWNAWSTMKSFGSAPIWLSSFSQNRPISPFLSFGPIVVIERYGM